MNILFVAPYVPNRIRVRPYQLIRALVNRSNEVTLMAVRSSQQEVDDLRELADLGVTATSVYLPAWRSAGNCAQSLLGDKPLQAAYSWHANLARNLEHLVAESDFDVVHVEHLRGSQYGVHLRTSQNHMNGTEYSTKVGRIPIVWDSVDCISHLFEQASQESRSLKGRLMTRLELNRTRKYEGWLVHQFDQVLVTSPADKAALTRLATEYAGSTIPGDAPPIDLALERKVNVLPNGVDLDYFRVDNEARAAAQIVFTGKMSYHANITAALHLVQDIMPLVWARRPDAEVWIVGKDPSREVRALSTSSAMESGHRDTEYKRVYITGTVPDLRPYLHKATIAVAPMPYGAGIQNKVLEAMACGAPVVASPQAASALSADPEHDLIVASDAEAFAEAILGLLEHPQSREQLGRAGRAYVDRRHSWDKIGAQLENIYAAAAQPVEHVS